MGDSWSTASPGPSQTWLDSGGGGGGRCTPVVQICPQDKPATADFPKVP